VHDTILRCRINAAFRNQVERRIYAAEGVPEEICPAPEIASFIPKWFGEAQCYRRFGNINSWHESLT